MPITNVFKMVPTASIKVDREARQRQDSLDIGDLIPSVRMRGILEPLIIDRDHLLHCGERRLLTAQFLELEVVPVRYIETLSEEERDLVELDENLKRSNLSWQDQARAVYRIHQRYLASDPDWTVEKTAEMIGLTLTPIARDIQLGEAMAEGDTSISSADTKANALTILSRRTQRKTAEAINRLMEIENDETDNPSEANILDEEEDILPSGLVQDHGVERGDAAVRSAVVHAAPKASPFAIVQADAHEWFSSYRGQPFNLLHVDFPYGVKLNGQAQQNNFEGGGYDSNPDIYWALCNSLVVNWDRIVYPSAHVMFWISMKFYTETVEFFDQRIPGIKINPTPLIWHKTDNRGILPDPLRGPRQIYEAALLMSTGDRHVVKPVSNVYGSPTSKADSIHTNEKPEPMLRHFFSMLVDRHSRVLDPTAGSGSSIRAAESLGAEAALGLEFNPEFAARAQSRLVQARGLRQLSSVIDSAQEEEDNEQSREEA